MSYWKPCQGQVTTPLSSSPSPRGPPRCAQVLAVANTAPSTLYRATAFPPISTAFAEPGGSSRSVATFTNSAMAVLLASWSESLLQPSIGRAVGQDRLVVRQQLLIVDLDEPVEQIRRAAAVDDVGARLLLDQLDDGLHAVGDPPGPLQDADHLPLVVGDGELSQRAGAPAHENDEVAGADVLDLAPHQTAAGVHQHVVALVGRAVLDAVLLEVQGRRDADHDPSGRLRPLHGVVRQTRARSRDQHAAARGDDPSHLGRHPDRPFAHAAAGRPHDAHRDLEQKARLILHDVLQSLLPAVRRPVAAESSTLPGDAALTRADACRLTRLRPALILTGLCRKARRFSQDP